MLRLLSAIYLEMQGVDLPLSCFICTLYLWLWLGSCTRLNRSCYLYPGTGNTSCALSKLRYYPAFLLSSVLQMSLQFLAHPTNRQLQYGMYLAMYFKCGQYYRLNKGVTLGCLCWFAVRKIYFTRTIAMSQCPVDLSSQGVSLDLEPLNSPKPLASFTSLSWDVTIT